MRDSVEATDGQEITGAHHARDYSLQINIRRPMDIVQFHNSVPLLHASPQALPP